MNTELTNHCPRVRQKRRSADFQSAVAQNCILRTAGMRGPIGNSQRTADYKSAIRRSAAEPQPKRSAAVCAAPAAARSEWRGAFDSISCATTNAARCGSQSRGPQNCAIRDDLDRYRPSATLRYFRCLSAALRTSRPASQEVSVTEGTGPCSRGGGAPRKGQRAFSLIELTGVLAVVAILAAALVPALIRQLDRIAGEQETAALKSFGDALQQGILRKRYVPGAT